MPSDHLPEASEGSEASSSAALSQSRMSNVAVEESGPIEEHSLATPSWRFSDAPTTSEEVKENSLDQGTWPGGGSEHRFFSYSVVRLYFVTRGRIEESPSRFQRSVDFAFQASLREPSNPWSRPLSLVRRHILVLQLSWQNPSLRNRSPSKR